MEPLWKRLVDDLRAQGHRSEYLDRLQARLPKAQSHADLQREILEEMASALGRAEEKINLALLHLELVGRDLDTALANGDRTKARALSAKFETFRTAAKQAVWELRVHRDALGLRGNEQLATLYPIPPRRTVD